MEAESDGRLKYLSVPCGTTGYLGEVYLVRCAYKTIHTYMHAGPLFKLLTSSVISFDGGPITKFRHWSAQRPP